MRGNHQFAKEGQPLVAPLPVVNPPRTTPWARAALLLGLTLTIILGFFVRSLVIIHQQTSSSSTISLVELPGIIAIIDDKSSTDAQHQDNFFDQWLRWPHAPTTQNNVPTNMTQAAVMEDAIVETFRSHDIALGTATSSYQVEGGRWKDNTAQNQKLREDNWWDVGLYGNLRSSSFCKSNHPWHNNNTGDVAIDFYGHYESDLEMVKNLGFDYFRFSIAWPRVAKIVPIVDETSNTTQWTTIPREEGLAFYEKLLDRVDALNLKPHICLYHWDLPSAMYPHADFTKPVFVDLFQQYTALVIDRFGDRVDWWITFNEPRSICQGGYGTGILAPGIQGRQYQCYHYLILAHAQATLLFRRKYPQQQFPRKWMGITNSGKVQLSRHRLGAVAADWWATWEMGIYLDPIFKFDYPAPLRKFLRDQHGIAFTPQEKQLLKEAGAPDYFAVQYYNFDLLIDAIFCHEIDQAWMERMNLAAHNVMPFVEMPWQDCITLCATSPATTNTERIGRYPYDSDDDDSTRFCIFTDNSQFYWPSANPNHPVELEMGLYNFILWAQLKYQPAHVMVTENGYPDEDSSSGYHTNPSYLSCGRLADAQGGGRCGGCSFSDVNDLARVIYYRSHLFQVIRAVSDLKDMNFTGYYAWSMFDNLEWCEGFRLRFGITCVDFTSPNRTRYYKQSALWFQTINTKIKARKR